MIVVGKADQIVFESVAELGDGRRRAGARCAVAAGSPLSMQRPTAYAASSPSITTTCGLPRRMRGCSAGSRSRSNLSAENAQLRELLKAGARTRGLLCHGAGHRQFGRRLCSQRDGQCRHDNGVARGQAAITGEGLVGRVSEVGSRAARILLITDLNSRVPVVVEGYARQRAMLAGDNSERPSLRYLRCRRSDTDRRPHRHLGRRRRLPAGAAGRRRRQPRRRSARVEPYVELSQVDYVRLVDYGLADACPIRWPIAARGGKRAESRAGGAGQR